LDSPNAKTIHEGSSKRYTNKSSELNGKRCQVYQADGSTNPVTSPAQSDEGDGSGLEEPQAIGVHTMGNTGKRETVTRDEITVAPCGDLVFVQPKVDRKPMTQWPLRRLAKTIPMSSKGTDAVHLVGEETPMTGTVVSVATQNASGNGTYNT
jgi:hypothetical protein